MKKLIFILFTAVAGAGSLWSQVTQLNQSFTAPFNATANGWFIQNNSNPAGTMTWAQGVGTVFPAHSGSADDFYCVNFNSVAGAGNISNWFVTPTVSLMNGGVLEVYSRTTANPASFPDRLRVRMSIGTGTGNIANSVSAVGTFTTLLFSINPNLTSTGYPGTWTLYTATLTGITGTVAGRFAFQYDVSNGGPNGSNSDFIGIDDVRYTTAAPCPEPTITTSPSDTVICPFMNVYLTASGATSYTWQPGPVPGGTIAVSPASTQVFTVTGINPGGCPGKATVTVQVVGTPSLSVANATACPGGTAALTASGATSFTWSTGSNLASITVTVNGPAVYTVTGATAPGCADVATVAVSNHTFLNVSSQNVAACPNQPSFLGASGAQSYTWNTGANTASIVITPTANATYVVSGTDGSCVESKVINVTIDPNLFAPSFTTCAGISATLIATGAASYSWSTGSTSSMVIVPAKDSVYTITGTSGTCSQTRTVSVKVSNKLSVVATHTCIGTTMLLSGYGANSYTWYPINDNNQHVFVNPTGPTVYTLAGSSGSCSGSQTLAVDICPGVTEQASQPGRVALYPNPFNAQLTVKNAFGRVMLITMTGEVLITASSEGSIVLDTGQLPAGIYLVMVIDNHGIPNVAGRVIRE